MTDLYYPLRSLREGHWFKLICGASFQYLPAIRNLVLAYALAGADCVDVAADPAVVATARAALSIAATLGNTDDERRSYAHEVPWLMVSLNDGEDPHFRKAEFDPATCPVGCPRPCELICPAQAIVFEAPLSTVETKVATNGLTPRMSERGNVTGGLVSGVLNDRCYGCGRCMPVCPAQQISTRSYLSTPAAIAPLVLEAGVDALEIHTQVGHLEDFRRLWNAIAPWICNLKLLAISCPDGDGLLDYLWALHDIISPLPCPLLWQMDGRPMSGDIGIGATRAAVKLGQRALAAGLPGYIQLAGGTNRHTVPKLKALGLLHPSLLNAPVTLDAVESELSDHSFGTYPPTYIAGIAYGSYARMLLAPVLTQLDAINQARSDEERSVRATMVSPLTPVSTSEQSQHGRQITRRSQPLGLEDSPTLLWQAVTLANTLVSQLKPFDNRQRTRLNL